MRKFFLFFLVFSFMLTPCVSAEREITVFSDGVQIEFDTLPFIENDRVMVPIRAISESLGANVFWEPESGSIFIETALSVLMLSIGSDVMFRNAAPLLLEAPPVIVNDRTYVPLRAVSEAFRRTVDWNGETRSVNIFSQDGDVPATKEYVSGKIEKEDGTCFTYDVAFPRFPEDSPVSCLNEEFSRRGNAVFLEELSQKASAYHCTYEITYNEDGIFSAAVIEKTDEFVTKTGYTVNAENGKNILLSELLSKSEEETDALLRSEVKSFCKNVLNLPREAIDNIDSVRFYYTFYITDDSLTVLIPSAYFTDGDTEDIELTFYK